MTVPTPIDEDHPWQLELRPDPASEGYEADASAALQALDILGAVILAVHVDTVPSLAQLMAGRSYVGWTLLVPGIVPRETIERIAATAGAAFRATVTPGHPLPRSLMHDPVCATSAGHRAFARRAASPTSVAAIRPDGGGAARAPRKR